MATKDSDFSYFPKIFKDIWFVQFKIHHNSDTTVPAEQGGLGRNA
jgi:hypothetical protein